jgi:hypothetical protein
MGITFIQREVDRVVRRDDCCLVWAVVGSVTAASAAIAAVGFFLI